MKIIITGCAGFIGMHVSQKLLERGDDVIGIDNLNSYYDPQLKKDRLNNLIKFQNFYFIKHDLSQRSKTIELFKSLNADAVIHLAAQAGVRHSVTFPHEYIDNNLSAFGNVLDGCKTLGIKHFVYASSSSIYGGAKKTPFKEDDCPYTPHSLYAATKLANELMAYSYSHLYALPTTGLRFFTAYGPWGRPDMAPFLFSKAIIDNKPINVFNNGSMDRDFTYIDDIACGVIGVLDNPPLQFFIHANDSKACSKSMPPYNIFNIGNNKTVPLLEFIELLEKNWGKNAQKHFLQMQAGDMQSTHACIDRIQKYTGYIPTTSIETGVEAFVKWYKEYYKILS